MKVLLVSFVIIIAFLTLQPTSESTILLQTREASLQSFFFTISKSNHVDTRTYWQTRDFYSPGSFLSDENGLPSSNAQTLLAEAGMKQPSLLTFNHFSSARVTSFENLIDVNHSTDIEKQMHGKKYLIIKKNPKKTVLVFITSTDEMKKTDGYLEFVKNKNFLKDKAWLSISEFTTNN